MKRTCLEAAVHKGLVEVEHETLAADVLWQDGWKQRLCFSGKVCVGGASGG